MRTTQHQTVANTCQASSEVQRKVETAPEQTPMEQHPQEIRDLMYEA